MREIKENQVYLGDCLYGLEEMKKQGLAVDLIVTDPPYSIASTRAGGKSELSRSIQPMFDGLKKDNLIYGIDRRYLEAIWSVMKIPNIYIWCNGIQIPQYIQFFVTEHKCKMDILIWRKTNAMPLFCNKYLTDKEYCLYFRRGGYCQPMTYEKAKTVYDEPINIKDKRKYEHPTVKPLRIIQTIVENSSRVGELVLDPFIGSGTTAVACKNLNRRYIGFEANENFYNICTARLKET